MTKRFEILDVLKGFSLTAILILHFLQQFEIENNYTFSLESINVLERSLKKVFTTIFSGNVYLIFSFIFGINLNFGLKNKTSNQFIIRLLVLFIIGYLHSLIYLGDILIFYAILGFILLFLNNYSNKVLYVVLTIVLLQLPLLYQIYLTIFENHQLFSSEDVSLIKKMNETYTSGSFGDVLQFNLWNGKYISTRHYLLSGRFFNILSFFIIGLLVYKNNILKKLDNSKKEILKVIYISVLGLVALFFINKINFSHNMNTVVAIAIYIKSLESIISSILYISVITYVYYFTKNKFNFFNTYGKASLTIYLTQSIIGVLIYYNFGLNLGNKIGFIHSLLLCIIVLATQYYGTKYWLSKFKKGPFEMVFEKTINLFKSQ